MNGVMKGRGGFWLRAWANDVTVNQEGGNTGRRLGAEAESGLLGVQCIWDTLWLCPMAGVIDA